jgi:hypothetical protein
MLCDVHESDAKKNLGDVYKLRTPKLNHSNFLFDVITMMKGYEALQSCKQAVTFRGNVLLPYSNVCAHLILLNVCRSQQCSC